MLGNGHVRFGGRVGETDRRQRRHRAPARPDPSSRVTTRVLSSLKVRPLGASQLASRALISSASSLEWHKARWSRTEARYRSFESARFLGPLPEPDVPITEHPALHRPMSMGCV
jgi:hypothetical protein